MNEHLIQNQHIFPAESLRRFSDKNGNIQVFRIGTSQPFFVKPKDKIFCVSREWDQRAEAGFGKSIEDEYQSLVEYCLRNNLREMPLNGNQTVNSFYALWSYRSNIKEFDGQLIRFNLTPNPLTNLERLDHELKHINYIDSDGDFPLVTKRGVVLQGGVISFTDRYKNNKWFMLRSPHLELVVPDNPSNNLFIPVSPNHCLVAGHDVSELSFREAQYANLKCVFGSRSYYCGRELSKCFNAYNALQHRALRLLDSF